jgi:hypothetical protein
MRPRQPKRRGGTEVYLNSSISVETFDIQIVDLSEHHWEQLCHYGFDKTPLYWGPDWSSTGHGITLSHLVNAYNRKMIFQPMRGHTPTDGHRFVVTKLKMLDEILQKLDLCGIPTRFNWVKTRLPEFPLTAADVQVDDNAVDLPNYAKTAKASDR